VGPLEFGYQGLPRDPETGLIYFRNRYYDPELGRFISADPKGYVDGPSEYAFEMDDPANGADPLGLRDLDEDDKKFIRGITKSQNELAAEYRKSGTYQGKSITGDDYEGLMTDFRTQRETYVQATWDAAPGQAILSSRQTVSWTDTTKVTRYFPQPSPEEIKKGNAEGERILAWTVAAPTVATGLLAGALPPTPAFAGPPSGRATTELVVEPAAPEPPESTSSGIGVTRHGVDQKITRGVRTADELDAIKNPLDTRPVQIDAKGRPSQRVVGQKAEVVRNPQTGKIVSVNPTETAKAQRLRRRNEAKKDDQ